MLKVTALVFILAGIFWYRSGSIINNVILFKTQLPVGYVADGDYAIDCQPLGPGNAENHLNALAYCEDTAFWELYDAVDDAKASSRLLLAGCDPNRKSWNTVMGPLNDPNPRGALWVYRPLGSAPERVEFKNYPEGHDFHPLGLEIWPSYGGNSSNLYVVNHARERTVIEHFVMNPSTPTVADHIRTISSPYFVSPNSVALTSPDSFYVTNDHLITRRWPFIGHILPLIESILGLPLAFISHITLNTPSSPDHTTTTSEIASHTFAATFIPFPNGIALSSSGRTLAFASSSLAKIYFYSRNPTTNALTRITNHTVPVPFCPDNVRFTPSLTDNTKEELMVAGHPHFPSLVNLAKNATGATSGSWVVSIIPKDINIAGTSESQRSFDCEAPVSTSKRVNDGPSWTLKTLFQSNGEEGGWVTSSTGIRDPDSGTLYVSGLYSEAGVIACKSRAK